MSKRTKKDVGAILHDDTATFRVWAPFATAVEVTGTFNDWGRMPLDNEQDGYWACSFRPAEPGQEYKFVVHDGENERWKNDPRSLQVTTSAGNSVLVDTGFDWGDDSYRPRPRNEQVIYELHVGTFYRPDPSLPGTFHSAIEKIDHLAELGIN